MNQSNKVQGRQYFLNATGIPKRCRSIKFHSIKGPFVPDSENTPEKQAQVIQVLKDRLVAEMKTVKKAEIKQNLAWQDDNIMSYSLFDAETLWVSEATK